jgi:hypothetical protein
VTSKGLAAVAGLPKLRHLKLWKAKGVNDEAIAAFLQMQQLEVLEMPETSVTLAGLKELAASPKQRLKHLFIGGIDLTPEQVDELRQAMPSCQISWWRKPAIEYPETGRRFGN